MVASAVPAGATEDEEGSGIGMDALAGLGLDEGGGEPEQSPTGDLNDPLAGGSGGSSEGSDTEETGSEPGTDQESDPADPVTSRPRKAALRRATTPRVARVAAWSGGHCVSSLGSTASGSASGSACGASLDPPVSVIAPRSKISPWSDGTSISCTLSASRWM
jgi:hypothetical protein